jgi:hypothetical protein
MASIITLKEYFKGGENTLLLLKSRRYTAAGSGVQNEEIKYFVYYEKTVAPLLF